MSKFETHAEWPAVQEVVKKLAGAGFQAWLAGGCVRDLLLGVEAKDFDIATNAKPEEVAALYPSALTVGREFGVTIIPFDGFQIEVATFRRDGPYSDGRRPESIEFSSAEEDAKRRDFTVNALFYDPVADRVYDFVEGEKDLRAKLLRAVGDPLKRFEEDKLRLLRAVRFRAQLGFEIEGQTLLALRQMAAKLSIVSVERIWAELKKMSATKGRGQGARALFETGLLQAFWPELARWLKADDQRTAAILRALDRLPQNAKPLAFWITLLGDFNCADLGAKALLRKLKASNHEVDEILRALDMYKRINDPSLDLFSKIQMASQIELESVLVAQELLKDLKLGSLTPEFTNIRREFLIDGLKLPEALVGGSDLLQRNIKPGPKFSEILNECHRHQILNKLTKKSAVLQFLDGLLAAGV